jgi:hypothetical protein
MLKVIIWNHVSSPPEILDLPTFTDDRNKPIRKQNGLFTITPPRNRDIVVLLPPVFRARRIGV